ncbi:hypothetical protein HJC23_010287 [Cyclotella cryptica]|uniref:Ribosomal RNA-processing protein 43 n=1 Tax=Cyclotella cryptica TaxID=29204 RepID=A0ABD3QP89_9STRA|eukprot:CCRYP_003675-RA/>CCRYP_003675-RA protein AED:0.13 eAED:0.15 QI:0/0/0/1/1/1/2/0/406
MVAIKKSSRQSSNLEGEYTVNNHGSSNQDWILRAYRSLEPGNYLREFTSKNVRPDGRPFVSSRPVFIQTGVLNRNSYGSAMVTLGGSGSYDGNEDAAGMSGDMDVGGSCTRVIAGCTLLVGRPSASAPHHGDIDVSVSANPLSGPRFDLGGRESIDSSSLMIGSNNRDDVSSDHATIVQLAFDHNNLQSSDIERPPQPLDIKSIESYLRRNLRSSRYINPEELAILPGKAAWKVRITVHILNAEGNVTDATMLCICAALKDLKLPMVEMEEVEGTGSVVKIVPEGEDDEGMGFERLKLQAHRGSGRKRQSGKKLTLGPVPIPTTIAILPQGTNKSKVLVVDPTSFEEEMSHGNTVTVICNTKKEVVDFTKRGSESKLSLDEMKAVMELGMERAEKLECLLSSVAAS